MPWTWSKVDRLRLTSYAIPKARELISLDVNILDLRRQPDGIREIVGIIYSTLMARQIQYALEPSSSLGPTQDIRDPSDILGPVREGTCLDLSLLFCGVCLGCELLPVLIVLDGHALVAVSLNHNLYEWNRRNRTELDLFQNVLAGEDKTDEITRLVMSGAYLAVECTGFARSHSLSAPYPEGIERQQDGTLTFDRATRAGEEHFGRLDQRAFHFALDIAIGQRYWGIQPLGESEKPHRRSSVHGSGAAPTIFDPLPYLLDRSDQEESLKIAVLDHRLKSPLRPLICLVHGDENECHAEFLTRLEKVTVPNILAFWYPEEVKRIPPLRKRMELSLKSLSEKNWEDILWGDLGAAIVGDRTAPHDYIVNMICRQKVAVIIDVPLLSERFEGSALKRLEFFFEFWNKWQNISEKLLLLICMSLKYQERYEVRRRKYEFWKTEGLNDRLRKDVMALDFNRYENLLGVSLPQLRAIPQTEAETAVNREFVKRCGLTDRDVIRIYKKRDLCTAEGHIPMCTLLEQFSETLEVRRS